MVRKSDECTQSVRSMHFSVQGELITRLARERVFYENPPRIKYAIDLLMSCLESDQMSEGDRLLLAVKILNGEARIVGTYPEDDYGVEMLEKPEGKFNLMERIERVAQEVEDLKKERRELSDKLACVAEELDLSPLEDAGDQQNMENGLRRRKRHLRCGPVGRMRRRSTAVSPQEVLWIGRWRGRPCGRLHRANELDYGWLAPDGTFYPVEFASHQSWAWKKLMELGAIEKYDLNAGNAGDKLVEMGWALLHNPGMGTAFVTSSDAKPLTKKQKDFLFDYYTKRNKHRKAEEYLG